MYISIHLDYILSLLLSYFIYYYVLLLFRLFIIWGKMHYSSNHYRRHLLRLSENIRLKSTKLRAVYCLSKYICTK